MASPVLWPTLTEKFANHMLVHGELKPRQGHSAFLQSAGYFPGELGTDAGGPELPDHLCDLSEHGNADAAVRHLAGFLSVWVYRVADAAASVADADMSAPSYTLDVTQLWHLQSCCCCGAAADHHHLQLGFIGSSSGHGGSVILFDLWAIQTGALSAAGHGDGEFDAGSIAVAEGSVHQCSALPA